MADPDVTELFDDDDSGIDEDDRRALFEPVVRRVVDALGGREDGGKYRLGDEVSACLKDLKKLWRKDDTDDERTIARIFWDTRVLPNDLVPILLETAGKGLVEDKRAIYCADLMTAMTWPIDMAEELKELDDVLDKGTDYTLLLQSHLHYKAALLKPGVIQALFGIMLPPLAKPPKERKERDTQVINVVLYLIRNLAFIKDLPSNSHLSSDQAELSSLQSKLIRALDETHTLSLLITISANATNDPMLNGWNALVLEIFYLLFRGAKPSVLAADQAKQPKDNLQRLLATEAQNRRTVARTASSRHSRFGTTIAVSLNPKKKQDESSRGPTTSSEPLAEPLSRSLGLHRQQALTHGSGSIIDMAKKQKFRKGKILDPVTREDNLSLEARNVLKNAAKDFLEGCFNPFLKTLLKDIRSERAKITEKDNLRLMFVTKWFLEFFLALRTSEGSKWNFGFIAEVTERDWIVWVLRRMREALDEKPKLWTELQVGIECMTQILLLIDAMASSDESMRQSNPSSDPFLNDVDVSMGVKEAADLLQQQLIYNGEVLDITFVSLQSYKDGTQSLAYLDSSVCLGYTLLRLLEKWGKAKGKEVYVRKKVAKKRRKKAQDAEDMIPDVEDIQASDSEEEVVHETLFTFEAFEAKLAHGEITRTLLAYLARYDDFTSSEQMKRVVSLMHRQAVKAKAEGLFFNVSTLNLFRSILADQRSLPREQPYKDLISLINYILRQFFKGLEKDPFLAVEAWFPMNRGHWKQFSTWQPEEKATKKSKKTGSDDENQRPAEVEVKKGYSWSDQLGIAIQALVEDGKKNLVDWVREILLFVIGSRQKLIEEMEASKDGDGDALSDDDDAELRRKATALNPFSNDAAVKFTDYVIPYISDEHASAATKNPHLKLLFRLCKFFLQDENVDELQWYVPAGIAPTELERSLKVIDQFLETPFDLDGKKASQLLGKKRQRRNRRRRALSPDSDEELEFVDDDPKRKKKKERQKKEKEAYKSAQFIEDSDEEYGDIDAFLEKEKTRRAKAERTAADAGKTIGTMKSTGTKKRRRRGADKGTSKKRKANSGSDNNSEAQGDSDDDVQLVASSETAPNNIEDSTPAKARPRPRPIRKSLSAVSSTPSSPGGIDADSSPPIEEETLHLGSGGVRRTSRLVLSDDDD